MKFKVLYHGTSEAALRTIARKGILSEEDRGLPCPTDEEFEDISEPYVWDGVWLTTSKRRAREFGPVILTIDATGITEDRIYEVFDEDVCIVGSIDPKLIRGRS